MPSIYRNNNTCCQKTIKCVQSQLSFAGIWIIYLLQFLRYNQFVNKICFILKKSGKFVILWFCYFLIFLGFAQIALSVPNTIPKIPLYIGKGYNILKGNPLSSEGVDPGFQHDVFVYTFNTQQTTEDRRYLVPDGLSHRKASACSFTTQINQYRGTISYQNELKLKAQIEGGYNGELNQASFTGSTTYQKIRNETVNQDNTITHASAECQCYEMSLNLFKPGPITDDFWAGVSYSFNAKNWDKFIEQFGTHFVYEVILGGRAIQQIMYSSKSISAMESLNIDIKVAAKANFAEYYADASFDYQQYTTQMKYSETFSEYINQIYIGGQPPQTGNILDWQEKVIDQPMPITYKVLPLSELLDFNPDKKFNKKGAKSAFLAALDNYCKISKCEQPFPDKPKPKPAIVKILKSNSYGGGGGQYFEWSINHPSLQTRKIMIRSGWEIDNIQISLSDGVTTTISPQFGGNGGDLQDPWVVPKYEHITQVEYRSGDRIDSLTFGTNKGNKSPRYGGTGGSYHLQTFPEGYRIIGLFGRSGDRLDNLGFILGKTQVQNITISTNQKIKN